MAAPVNSFKADLKAGKQTIGCWLTQGTAIAAEIAATADFDWLLVDAEQGYQLSALGNSLLAQLRPLADWAQRWARELEQAGR